MVANTDKRASTFQDRSMIYIVSVFSFFMLFFSLDWLSLFLFKLLRNHRAAFWIAIGIHLLLLIVGIIKYRLLFKKIEFWLRENDQNMVSKYSNDNCFYFKRD
jgi:hypothetical protein